MNKFPTKKANEGEDELSPQAEWLYAGIDIESRRIEIRSEINEVVASVIVRSLLKMSSINKEPIELYLSSFGGDAYEGLAIYDAIIACDCDVHIIASGKIMSAAFLVFLAGDVRIASEHTTFMMHSASYGAEGTVKNHEVQVNEGKRLNNLFLDIAAKRTKRPKKWWYRKILNTDYYLNVDEAKELGVLTTKPTPKPVKKTVRKKNVRK